VEEATDLEYSTKETPQEPKNMAKTFAELEAKIAALKAKKT